MTYGRCEHLSYHHRKARVRKKNKKRMERIMRKKTKQGMTFFELLPDHLKDYLRNAPACDGQSTYPADFMSVGGMWYRRTPYSQPWWEDQLFPKPSFIV